jgi:hypothetical protein
MISVQHEFCKSRTYVEVSLDKVASHKSEIVSSYWLKISRSLIQICGFVFSISTTNIDLLAVVLDTEPESHCPTILTLNAKAV